MADDDKYLGMRKTCVHVRTTITTTYHNTNEVELGKLIVFPLGGQSVLFFATLSVEQNLNGVIRRGIRRINATTKELQKWKKCPAVEFSMHRSRTLTFRLLVRHI